MPALEVIAVNPPEESTQPSSQPVVGIIYPPPEVRNIVDKTASFVARNGPEFESRIRQNEVGNPKFNFLSLGDPYHAYYQHKVKEFREGRGQEPVAVPPGFQQKAVASSTQLKQQELLKQAEAFIPKDPPVEFEFIADPPSISALDLDVVKLTAQFVARNGRQFLTNLMNREQRNYQFDFLRPQHSLFQYFTKLLEQYTKVIQGRVSQAPVGEGLTLGWVLGLTLKLANCLGADILTTALHSSSSSQKQVVVIMVT
uniref:SURP motif domain-containing protein n=1 Tax=Graphocephala atropunctata TaxID=36148 RepID=A0A1B6LWF0_9HEMI